MAKNRKKFILLTFDVEEFDIPQDYEFDIDLDDQLRIGHKGLINVMELLADYPNVRATFFTTAVFAKRFPDTIRFLSTKHEIASHTYSNSSQHTGDLLLSRLILEQIIGKPVCGIRMPQMQSVDADELKNAGYSYDSSVHPTWIPGKYNNLNKPVGPYYERGILRIPASVSGVFRIPLFWLCFKNLPLFIYECLAYVPLRKHGFLNVYFHPWEFEDISSYPIPRYVKVGSPHELLKKLGQFLKNASKRATFITMSDFISMRTANEP